MGNGGRGQEPIGHRVVQEGGEQKGREGGLHLKYPTPSPSQGFPKEKRFAWLNGIWIWTWFVGWPSSSVLKLATCNKPWWCVVVCGSVTAPNVSLSKKDYREPTSIFVDFVYVGSSSPEERLFFEKHLHWSLAYNTLFFILLASINQLL